MARSWTATDDPPAGLVYVPEFVTPREEADLVARLAVLPFAEVVMRGVTARRTVVHYGWQYGYSGWTLVPGPAPPAFLLDVRARAAALAGVAPETLAQVLVTRYPPGAGIGWHRDAPLFGPTVVGVSLAGPALMRFRTGKPGARILFRRPLAPRSAYVLSGGARGAWQHSVAPAPALRYSVTFRSVRSTAVAAR